MFAKLLKHEWKANGGLLSILSAGALGAGLLGALVLRLLIYLQKQNAMTTSALPSALILRCRNPRKCALSRRSLG